MQPISARVFPLSGRECPKILPLIPLMRVQGSRNHMNGNDLGGRGVFGGHGKLENAIEQSTGNDTDNIGCHVIKTG